MVAVGAGGEDEALGPVDGVQLGQAEGEDGGAAVQTLLVCMYVVCCLTIHYETSEASRNKTRKSQITS